jgi:hypothetical protein
MSTYGGYLKCSPRVTNASRLQEKHSQHEKEESGEESLAMGHVNVAADLDSEQQLQPLPR